MSNPGVLALSLSLVSNSASYISSFNTVLPYLSLLGLIIFILALYLLHREFADSSTFRYRIVKMFSWIYL